MTTESAFPDGVSFGGGMTLRDYFAAQSVSGVMAMIASGQHQRSPTDATGANFIADSAYKIADAMMKARSA